MTEGAPAREIEFKLRIDPEPAAGLWPFLAARFPGLKPSSHSLFTAYYDTPAGHLRRLGVALRLRRQDDRWVQTVKREASASGGLHQRIEHETQVAAQLPSFPAMTAAGIGDVIADRKLRESLAVVFTTEFTRQSAMVSPAHGALVEVALDQGVIAAGTRREPICEIELELKAGGIGALFGLAEAIAGYLPVRLDNDSKAERGYGLATGRRTAPVKASDSPVQPDMDAQEAFAALALDALAHLQANERGLLEGRNPEYLHQARVALRRLRSLFRIFEPILPAQAMAPLLDELKGVARTLGLGRNHDVFQETLASAGARDYAGMAELWRRARHARRLAARSARQAVADQGYVLLMLRLTAALASLPPGEAVPLRAFAAEALGRHHEKAKKRGRGIVTLAYEDLHRLRIALKRLRYASEFFEPFAPQNTARAIDALEQLQDLLGKLNDGATAWKLLDALAVEDFEPGYQQALGYVRGWTARDAVACRNELAAAWKRFGKLKPWWS